MCVSQQCSRETQTLIVSIFFSCNVAAPSCGHFASLQVTSNKELNSLSLKILISLWFDLNHFGVRRKCCFQPMWSRLGGKMYWPDAVVSKSFVMFFTCVLHFHFWTKECDRKFCPKWFILLEETKWCPVKAPIHRVEILQFKVSEYLTCKTSRVTFSYNVFGSLT